VFQRILGDEFSDEVRRGAAVLTISRLVANGTYRYTPPFLAAIATGLDVSIATMGMVLGISELFGLFAPWLGRRLDGYGRRSSMLTALGALTVSATVTAVATGPIHMGASLFMIGLTKMSFDIAAGSWIADRVHYSIRGRVVGVVETSWAGSLLIVVPLMGLVTALANWRWAFVTSAVLVLGCAGLVHRALPAEAPDHVAVAGPRIPIRQLPGSALLAATCFGALCATSQCVFVTFGPWLEDHFDVGNVGVAVVSAVIGVCELGASVSTIRLTDRWGKERAARAGAALMIPGALALLWGHGSLGIGLMGVLVVIAGFEFALVSTLPLASEMVQRAPGVGIGLCFFAGTIGRAAVSPAATSLYEHVGMVGPAAAAAAGAVIATILYNRLHTLLASTSTSR
jgi:predicted MFS family arabinose efflux permease